MQQYASSSRPDCNMQPAASDSAAGVAADRGLQAGMTGADSGQHVSHLHHQHDARQQQHAVDATPTPLRDQSLPCRARSRATQCERTTARTANATAASKAVFATCRAVTARDSSSGWFECASGRSCLWQAVLVAGQVPCQAANGAGEHRQSQHTASMQRALGRPCKVMHNQPTPIRLFCIDGLIRLACFCFFPVAGAAAAHTCQHQRHPRAPQRAACRCRHTAVAAAAHGPGPATARGDLCAGAQL